MNSEQATAVLLQVARLSQKCGILSLEDAVVVAQAVKILTKNEEVEK